MIAIHQVEQQPIVSIRAHCRRPEIPAFVQWAFGELDRRLRDLDIAPSGHLFVIYHAFGEDGLDAEVALPVRERVAGTGVITSRVVPAMTVARAVHVGPYDGIERSHSALSRWVQDHAFETPGSVLERYLVGPADGVPAGRFRTELEMPLVEDVVAAPV